MQFDMHVIPIPEEAKRDEKRHEQAMLPSKTDVGRAVAKSS
jgi:hypothetical protein